MAFVRKAVDIHKKSGTLLDVLEHAQFWSTSVYHNHSLVEVHDRLFYPASVVCIVYDAPIKIL